VVVNTPFDFACGVIQRNRPSPLTRIGFSYPFARATVDGGVVTITPRPPFPFAAIGTVRVELAGVRSASVKLRRVLGYLRIDAEGSGSIFLTARRTDMCDFIRLLTDCGVTVAERKNFQRLRSR
jgi:hypothetical protein